VKEKGGALGVADDDSGAFLSEHTPFLGFGTPVSALFAAEESQHTGWLLSLGVLYERRALISHVGPGASLVKNYLYASAHASAPLRATRTIVHGTRKRGCWDFGAVRGKVISMLASLRCRRSRLASLVEDGCSKWRAATWRMRG